MPKKQNSMTNGFYNPDPVKDNLFEFVKDAILHASLIKCEEKYSKITSNRKITFDFGINDFLNWMSNIGTIVGISIVDRTKYHNSIELDENEKYEIVLDNVEKQDSSWKFLWINLNKENFYKIINKYKLELIEW